MIQCLSEVGESAISLRNVLEFVDGLFKAKVDPRQV